MVLSRRTSALGVLGVVLLAGCGESLFDGRGPGGPGGPGDGGDDQTASCNAPCVADAAIDFDGTPTGKGGRWRYLADSRSRTWGVMTAAGTEMTDSNDPRNHITTCAGRGDTPACEALPRALLVSSAGAAGPADAAIEFTASTAQVVELRVRAFVAATAEPQKIRLYRNSGEDVLFTGVANPGQLLDQTVVLDALAGDRFLVAVGSVSATGHAVTDVGLHLRISSTSMTFPSTCQLALAFEVQTGNSVRDLCRSTLFTLFKDDGRQGMLVRNAGPYFEQGYAATVPTGTRLADLTSKVLDHTHDLTVQFWIKLTAPVATNPAWLFSDLTGDGGGVGVSITQGALPPALDVVAYADPQAPVRVDAIAPFPLTGEWQFIRVVQTATAITACVNGARVASTAAVGSALLPTFEPATLGSEGAGQAGFFGGQLDDVRAITGALPCE